MRRLACCCYWYPPKLPRLRICRLRAVTGGLVDIPPEVEKFVRTRRPFFNARSSQSIGLIHPFFRTQSDDCVVTFAASLFTAQSADSVARTSKPPVRVIARAGIDFPTASKIYMVAQMSSKDEQIFLPEDFREIQPLTSATYVLHWNQFLGRGGRKER